MSIWRAPSASAPLPWGVVAVGRGCRVASKGGAGGEGYHVALGINVVGYMQRLVLGELLVRRVHDPPMEAVLELGKDAHGREHQTEPLGNSIGRPDYGDGANEHASSPGTLRSVRRRRGVENWSWCEVWWAKPSRIGIFRGGGRRGAAAAAVAAAVARSQWAESGVEVGVPPAR